MRRINHREKPEGHTRNHKDKRSQSNTIFQSMPDTAARACAVCAIHGSASARACVLEGNRAGDDVNRHHRGRHRAASALSRLRNFFASWTRAISPMLRALIFPAAATALMSLSALASFYGHMHIDKGSSFSRLEAYF